MMRPLIVIAALLLGLWVAPPSLAQLMGGGFIGKTPSGGGSCLSLDCVTDTAIAAYSTVKLRSAYAGNCMTIKRASDSTTLAIGFSGNTCDQASASAFCAATSCWFTVWNDQSGNGNNCVTGSDARSPALRFSDVNGKIALDFNTNNSGLQSACTVTLSSGVSSTTIQGVFFDTGSAATPGDFWANGAFGATSYTRLNTNGNNTQGFTAARNSGSGDHASTKTGLGFNVWGAVFATLTNSRSAIFVNGAQGVDDTTALTLVSHTDAGSSAAGFSSGHIAEIIIWSPSISDADAKTVCRTEGATFGISTSC